MIRSLTIRTLYTVITKEVAKGKKEAIIVMEEGTTVDRMTKVIQRSPRKVSAKVLGVTLDIVGSMNIIVALESDPYKK